MAQLKSRDKAIPRGFSFYVPETKWRPDPWSSFESVVAQLLSHRRGNRKLAEKHGWSLDINVVRSEVDAFNTKVCRDNGWNQFIIEGDPSAGSAPPASPKVMPPQAQRKESAAGAKLASGALTLAEMLGPSATPVDRGLAEQRAMVCAGKPGEKPCKFNAPGDLTSIFTIPAARMIQKGLEILKKQKLTTTRDEQLNVCELCSCPLRLKIHVPIGIIMGKIPSDVFEKLPGFCWIKKESLTET